MREGLNLMRKIALGNATSSGETASDKMNVFLKQSSIKQQPHFVSSCFVIDENTYLTLSPRDGGALAVYKSLFSYVMTEIPRNFLAGNSNAVTRMQ